MTTHGHLIVSNIHWRFVGNNSRNGHIFDIFLRCPTFDGCPNPQGVHVALSSPLLPSIQLPTVPAPCIDVSNVCNSSIRFPVPRRCVDGRVQFAPQQLQLLRQTRVLAAAKPPDRVSARPNGAYHRYERPCPARRWGALCYHARGP